MNRNPKVFRIHDVRRSEEVLEALLAMPAVYIYSDTVGYECYWRPNGSGYCNRVAGVGVFTGQEAWDATKHISEGDQFIEYEEAQKFVDDD